MNNNQVQTSNNEVTKEIKVNNTTFIVKDTNTPSIKLIAEAVVNLSRSI